MTFRFALVLLATFAGTITIEAEEPNALSAGESLPSAGWLAPVGRPFLLRSDALSHANYAKVRSLASMKIDPRTGVQYDWRGFPMLKSHFDVQLSPAQYSSAYYGKICNEQLYREIQRNPALRKRFTERDIELLKHGKNPQGTQWHHDPRQKGRMQLVNTSDHSVDHVGGDKVWGRIDRETFLRSTALRWGSVAVFDLAISSAGLLYAGEFDLDHFGQATTRAIAGGTAAFGTEYLVVRLMPQTVGMPPGWFAGMRILYGSPAAWGATLSYAATRALVDYCWESYRLHQLQIQEQACRIAETKARWQLMESAVTANDQALSALLVNFDSTKDLP